MVTKYSDNDVRVCDSSGLCRFRISTIPIKAVCSKRHSIWMVLAFVLHQANGDCITKGGVVSNNYLIDGEIKITWEPLLGAIKHKISARVIWWIDWITWAEAEVHSACCCWNVCRIYLTTILFYHKMSAKTRRVECLRLIEIPLCLILKLLYLYTTNILSDAGYRQYY